MNTSAQKNIKREEYYRIYIYEQPINLHTPIHMHLHIKRTSHVKTYIYIERDKIRFTHLHIQRLKPFSGPLAVASARIKALPFIALPKLTTSNLYTHKQIYICTHSTSWFVFQKKIERDHVVRNKREEIEQRQRNVTPTTLRQARQATTQTLT